MTADIRVVVADDHRIVREGLVALLTALAGVEVVGSAADGLEAVEVVAALRPDVVVMDIQMPRLDGIEATRRIVAADPGARVVMLTMTEDDDTVRSALAAGARGYLLKGADAAEVLRAIGVAADGGLVLGAAIGARVAALLVDPAPAPMVFPDLTERERGVLALMADGRSNADIARTEFLSPKTVRNIVSAIYTKLQAADRADAVLKAREAGLGRRRRG